jgi:Tol biopolymer transport system component
MRRSAARLTVVALLLATASPLVTTAEATTPGHNGVLAFVRLHADFCPDLRTVQVAGTSARTLVSCPQYIGEPGWAPSGKRLAVSYIRNSGSERLALLPATGGTPQAISTNISPAHSPSFDRTGQVLAFTGGDAGGTDQRALYTVPVTGGTATRLTPNTAEVDDEPDYSPTANTIAWTRRTATSYDVWTVAVNGQGHNPTALTNLTNGAGNSRYPSWSPDGTRLAFASDRSGT